MDSCNYKDQTINCKTTNVSQDLLKEYECCSEEGNSRLGRLVKKGTCDHKRGICERSSISKNKGITQRIVSQITEGFNGGCRNHMIPIFLISIVLVVLLLIIIFKN